MQIILIGGVGVLATERAKVVGTPARILWTATTTTNRPVSGAFDYEPCVSAALLGTKPELLIEDTMAASEPAGPAPAGGPLFGTLLGLVPVRAPGVMGVVNVVATTPGPVVWLGAYSVLL